VFFGGLSKWPHVFIFFFWRLAYDVGLGLLLRAQSERKWFTKLYISLYERGGTWKQLLDHLARMQLFPSDRAAKPIDQYPTCFRAWLVYKNLVNIILVNDGLTYLLLGLKCFHLPSQGLWALLSPSVMAQYGVGLFLCVFNYWAKVDAHRCIGEFCWYWGDFFFRKDLHLNFDGIFELFPHPMYTVGYSLYYGYSLLARSYTMLFVSLLAHGMQLAFLCLVEEPHIVRTYGSATKNSIHDRTKWKALYDPKSGFFPEKRDNVFLLVNFDLFRSGDLAVAFCCLYGILLAFLPSSPTWSLAQVIFWRLFHWVGLGVLLWAQSNFELWTRHFTTRGRTLYEAFGQWKNTYNLSLTMNIVVFIACALRHCNFSLSSFASAQTMACVAVGFVLVCLSVWSFLATYEAVGEFGWFYGDFFLRDSRLKPELCYTGIYRFLNNPDAVTGYAGQYGLALMAQSWPIFFLALGSQLLNVLFLNLVEIPHMQRLYSRKERRDDSPFPRALRRIKKQVLGTEDLAAALPRLPLPKPLRQAQQELEKNLKQEVRKIRERALEEVWQVYKTLAEARKNARIKAASPASTEAASPDASPSPRPSPSSSSSPSLTPSPSSSSSSRPMRASSGSSSSGSGDVTLMTPSRIQLGESLTVRYTAQPLKTNKTETEKKVEPKKGGGKSSSTAPSPSSTVAGASSITSRSSYDWIGIYPVDVASAPAASDGNWQYVEPCTDPPGSVTFPPTLLPNVEGVYEVRYHRCNGYEVEASLPFMMVENQPEEEDEEEEEEEEEEMDGEEVAETQKQQEEQHEQEQSEGDSNKSD